MESSTAGSYCKALGWPLVVPSARYTFIAILCTACLYEIIAKIYQGRVRKGLSQLTSKKMLTYSRSMLYLALWIHAIFSTMSSYFFCLPMQWLLVLLISVWMVVPVPSLGTTHLVRVSQAIPELHAKFQVLIINYNRIRGVEGTIHAPWNVPVCLWFKLATKLCSHAWLNHKGGGAWSSFC